jgi:hypothetical protein
MVMPAILDAFLGRSAKRLACGVALGVLSALPGLAQQSTDPTSGTALYEDVKRYDAFGVHRYGTAGLDAALDWMAARLRAAGFVVEEQAFAVGRQYFLDAASLKVGSETLEVLPQWWLPEAAASFSLSAPIARDGPAEGRFVRLRIPYDEGAYLGKNQRAAVAEAMRRHPAAVLLTIDHPSGELFAYNVSQTDEPWPVPVILVAPKDEAKLAAAEATGEPLTLSVRGRYERNVPGRNVIGRLDRGKARTVVVSTPVSSWFTSTCERGPGIAAFLATAEVASRSMTDVNFVFVGTSGHEVGHGGMEHFIHAKAPPPKDVAAWLHYGASLACYARPMTGANSAPAVNGRSRYLLMSSGLQARVEPAFHDLMANRLVGAEANVGELREIMGAGYTRAFGMAGLHPLFHTSRDSAEMTSAALLEPVVQDFVRALRAVAEAP